MGDESTNRIGFLAMRKLTSLVVFLLVCGSCFAQENFALSELQFKGPFGTRAGDGNLYCLLGNGFFRTISSDDEATVVSAWRTRHPDARVVPVSVMGEGSRMRIVYIWAVDGNDNLNLQLIRDGVFPASVMLDAVHFDQLLKRSAPTPERKSIEAGIAYGRSKTHAAPPVEAPPRRLVPDARYQAFLKDLMASEHAAQARKNGIWSDKFKDLREEENTAPLDALLPASSGTDQNCSALTGCPKK